MGISYLPRAARRQPHEPRVARRRSSARVASGARIERPSGSPCARIHSRCSCSTTTNTPTATLAAQRHERSTARRVGFARSSTRTASTPTRYTLKRHYTIPPHPVAEHGARSTRRTSRDFERAVALVFRRGECSFTAIAADDAERVVGALLAASLRHRDAHRGRASKRTVGVGMEPGDVYYAEPYFYVNMSPSPSREAPRPALDGGGAWHTHEWIGAVLPASRIVDDRPAAADARRSSQSAIAACTAMRREAPDDYFFV